MKKSDLVRIIREELKAITELTQAEKSANIKAVDADIEAKKLALKGAQDKATKTKAAPVDQK
tara:strand:- start:565 stop:750 length:186 start_codon:yes stop_codon:yes gene_type:complete